MNSNSSSKVTIIVGGMSCAACVRRVENLLKETEGVTSVSVNLATGRATLEVTKDFDIGKAKEAIEKGGYKWLGLLEEKLSLTEEFKRKEEKELLYKLIFSSILTVLIHLLTMSSIESYYKDILLVLLTFPVMFWAGSSIMAGALKATLNKTADMNTLVAIGSLSAFIYSLFASFYKSAVHGVYYDGAATIITLVLLGRFLELRARDKTTSSIKKLLSLRPPSATILREDKTFEEIPAEQVKRGDLLILRPGDKCAVDGVVVEGFSHVDESMLTGESLPVSKKPGDKVYAGTMNIDGKLIYEATKEVGDTFLDSIVRLVEEAQGRKAPIQCLADKIASVFVPVVMVIAILAFLIWWKVLDSFYMPFMIACSVLLIACPCAMGLATPAAIMVGTGLGAEEGVLFKGGDVFEKLGQVKTIVFDKTGTLTESKPYLYDIVCNGEVEKRDFLKKVFSVEVNSTHPLARAIAEFAKKENIEASPVEDFTVKPGLGAYGKVDGKEIFIGNEGFMKMMGVSIEGWENTIKDLTSNGKTVVFVAIEGILVGLLAFSDKLKKDAKEAITKLKDLGLRIVMLTGDRLESATFIAKELGIEEVIPEVLPDKKAEVIDSLKKETSSFVAMVGDGINDAPALVSADVGIAIGAGTDIAISASDVTLVRDNMLSVVSSFLLSKLTIKVIKQNLFWAFFYNVITIPLAAGAFYPFFGLMLTPKWAAAAMAMSSVSVVVNSLRLKYIWKFSRP